MVLALLDAAARDGLTIHFGVGPDAFNRQCITQFVVTRVFKELLRGPDRSISTRAAESIWIERAGRQRRVINYGWTSDSIAERRGIATGDWDKKESPEGVPFQLIAGERRYAKGSELGLAKTFRRDSLRTPQQSNCS